jgi:glucan-binding YG repeat protein
MEETLMKLVGIIGTALLSLILAAPVYAQEQHDQDEQKDQKEQTAKPAQDEKKAETDKSAKQDEKGAQPDKNAKPEEKNAQQEKNTKPEEKSAKQENNSKQEEKTTQQHAQPAKNAGGIPADRYKANFGREHTFRVSQGDYNNHRFQYGGYWFGFAAPWPGNWLYTQQVFVVDIGGVYYLCNPTYPGVNVELNITL